MMTKIIRATLLVTLLFSIGCDEKDDPTSAGNNTTNAVDDANDNSNVNDDSTTPQEINGWLIPISQVINGGPGKDGIPALTNPEKGTISSITNLADSDLVLGYKSGNEVVAVPHSILDWHEISNEDIGSESVAIVYCPLTGTGIGWERTINGANTTFGVSGLLYNNNIIPYDRATDSNWSQMRLECVNGSLIGTAPKTYTLVETTWSSWKEMYPDSKVVNTNTGYQRSYGQYPYGDYKTNNDYILFPLSFRDDRLPKKERVHGLIVNKKAKVYRFSSFSEEVTLINDNFQESDLLIVGNLQRNFIASFYKIDGLTFTAVQNGGRIVLTDDEGNKWDIFGYAIEGPRTGERLTPTESMMGYWFSWGTFYPGCEIYE